MGRGGGGGGVRIGRGILDIAVQTKSPEWTDLGLEKQMQKSFKEQSSNLLFIYLFIFEKGRLAIREVLLFFTPANIVSDLGLLSLFTDHGLKGAFEMQP